MLNSNNSLSLLTHLLIFIDKNLEKKLNKILISTQMKLEKSLETSKIMMNKLLSKMKGR